MNVIFDPSLIEASVDYLRAEDFRAPKPAEGRSFALYCLAGVIGAGPEHTVAAKSAALFTRPPKLRLSASAEALLITLDRRKPE
jgi:hypothetical protein